MCGIGIILLTDLLCGITSYYFSVDLRFDCIFKLVTVQILPTVWLNRTTILVYGHGKRFYQTDSNTFKSNGSIRLSVTFSNTVSLYKANAYTVLYTVCLFIIKRVKNQIVTYVFVYRSDQIFNLKIIENATTISERSKGPIFLGAKLVGSKHLGKNQNLKQREKFLLIAR